MALLSSAFTRQKLCIDFATLKHAAPKGVYVAPIPDTPLLWTGVLFVRNGPYQNAVLRFHIDFHDDYPQKPPVITFQSDLFHPLVAPNTTYKYNFAGTDTQSAADNQRLPPGGLSLRHGFPEWFRHVGDATVHVEPKDLEVGKDQQDGQDKESDVGENATVQYQRPPHIVELLQYLRVIFDTEEVLDAIPIEAAANTGAWHAWTAYRVKASPNKSTAVTRSLAERTEEGKERSTSPRQQPGGARRPGEWNWQGVWEDRVRKSIQTSASELRLYGGDKNDVVSPVLAFTTA